MISSASHEQVSDVLAELASKPVVLVVEDELLVRIVQVDILREAGFRVAERKTRTRHSRCSEVGPRS
jgi:hypothetical protein